MRKKYLWRGAIILFVVAGPALVGHVNGAEYPPPIELRGVSIVEKIREGVIKDLGVIDKDRLVHVAERLGLGYKTANLIELDKLTKNLSDILHSNVKTRYNIGVPQFVGISSGAVKQFLSTQGVGITEEWTSLMKTYFPVEQRNKNNPMFQTKKFPDNFLKEVKDRFVVPIMRAFDEAKNVANGDALHLSDDIKKNIDTLIEEMRGKRLMVRSSGKEDTDKLANAGGNETKANVIPEWPSVIEAIKEVVVSYFGEKSLIQRLGAGDETLFEEPMTPVLIQWMVGEEPGGESNLQKILRCGVMFTEEPEGGLSRMNPKNKSETSGITIIQASYGHNEGVVNSIVPVDTYYVDALGNMFPVIRPKFFRLIPSRDSGKLERSARHPHDWIYVSALKEEEVYILKLLANALEHYYQGPMDVEYVINRNGGKIWIVQARPIVHNQNQPTPSYLRPEFLKQLDIVSCEAIGVAGGKLRIANSDKQCIVKKTIGQALEAYQDVSTDRTNVECIVVGQHAPATSHEATTFRSELKPVVFTKDWEKVASWLGEQKKVIVDVQQGIIAPWEASDRDLISKLIEDWVSYPIPAKMSIWPRKVKTKKLIDLDKIPDEDTQKMLLLVGKNLEFMENCFNQLGLIADQDRRNKHALLYKQFKKAIGTQQGTLGASGEIVNGYSYVMLKKQVKADIWVKKSSHQLARDERALQLIKLKQYALVDQLAKNWHNFVEDKVARASADQRKSFFTFISWLGGLGSLELWLHTEFNRYKDSTVEAILDASWDEKTKRFLKGLDEKKQLLKQTNLGAVADPNKFKKVWDDFNTNMVSYFIGEFVEGFKQATPTGRLAALSVMKDFVEVFDDALKTMSRSNAYSIFTGEPSKDEADRIKNDKDKGFVFKLMLKKNLEVLTAWWSLYCLVDPEAKVKISFDDSKVEYALEDVGRKLEKLQLGSSVRDFEEGSYNVAEGAIGSKAAWDRGMPQSLENIFTWIHQSQIAVVSFLNQFVGLNPSLETIPNELKDIDKKLTKSLSCAKCIGSSLEKGVLKLFYNWSLRNHAASITVSSISATKNIELVLNFFGENTAERWDIIVDIFELSGKCRANILPRGVEIIWPIRVDSEIDELIALAREAENISNRHFVNNLYSNFGKPLAFWADYKHCGILFSSDFKDFDGDASEKIIDKLLTDKNYKEKSLKLIERLRPFVEHASSNFVCNFSRMIDLLKYKIDNTRLKEMLDWALSNNVPRGITAKLGSLLIECKLVDYVIKKANDLMENENTAKKGLLLLHLLIEKNLIKAQNEALIVQAIGVVKKNMTSNNNKTFALKLWNDHLRDFVKVQNEEIIKHVVAILQINILTSSLSSETLLRVLIGANRIKEVVDMAKEGMKNQATAEDALKLWELLIREGALNVAPGNTEALEAVKHGMADPDIAVFARKLWENLINKKFITEENVGHALKEISGDKEKKTLAMAFFKAWGGKGQLTESYFSRDFEEDFKFVKDTLGLEEIALECLKEVIAYSWYKVRDSSYFESFVKSNEELNALWEEKAQRDSTAITTISEEEEGIDPMLLFGSGKIKVGH